MQYGIGTMSGVTRGLNITTNVMAAFVPFLGASGAQRIRGGLETIYGSVGFNRYSIYYDSDIPEITFNEGTGFAVDLGAQLLKKDNLGSVLNKTLQHGAVAFSGFNAVNQLFEDLQASRIDSYINRFHTGVRRGMFKNISDPQEAVRRAQMFVDGAQAFFENDLQAQGINFTTW